MKLIDLKPRDDALTNRGEYIRVLWGAGDIWQMDSRGAAHRRSAGYCGERFSVRVPELIPLKYRNRKITSVIVYCDLSENVTGIEAHYGQPAAGGYSVTCFPDSGVINDTTDFYRS